MSAATALQRKPQGEETETAAAVSGTTTPSIMPSRATPLAGRSAIIQAQSFISSPDDAAEREADRVAAHVVSMPEPSPKAGARAPTSVMRSPLIMQRRAAPARRAPRQAASGGNVMQQVKAAASGGFALSKKTRAYLEPRFKADFSNVRLHTDGKAKELSNKVGARAFTFGRHIFFNEGQYNPDSKAGLELLAHELTHTIQQREAIQRKPMVHERTDRQVQRIGNPFAAVADAVGGAIDAVGEFVGDVLQIVKDFAAEHADILPGFKILCLVLGYNPINDAPAPGGGRAILKELTTFIPFGDKVFEALNNHGIIDKGGAFIDAQIAGFKALASSIIGAISSFFGSLGPGDALNPLGAWGRLKSSFSPVFASMKSFASGLISGFIDLVREVILKPMARWAAANIPHWDLLMGVLGVNPVSGDGESPAMQLIGVFMKLIGQDEVWENIKKGNAIARAWAWFQGAMSGAKALVSDIPGLVVSTIKSLTIVDVLTVVGAAQKIIGAFVSFAGKFGKWALGTVIDLLEIVLSVVAPTVIPYLKKAGAAFKTILQNPGAFISSLVAAGKLGFGQFAGNFVKHLKSGLIDWMTGSLGGAGVYIPQSFALRELLKFGLSVIGLTWTNVRTKLVAATNEPTVLALEEGFKLVKTLVVEGPAAAWEQLLESLSNLKSMVMDAIIDYIKGKVIAIAVEKVLSMLTPAGAFIQAVLAIYRTITFIVGELQRIAALVAALIDGIAAIASGVIGPAANKVENILARGLSLAISFLADFAGLGDISKKVLQVLDKIRAPVNKAIDKVIAWIVAQAKKLGRFILQAGTPADPNARLKLAIRDAGILARGLGKRISRPTLERAIGALRTRYSLTGLSVSERNRQWSVTAAINPTLTEVVATTPIILGPDGRPAASSTSPAVAGAREAEGPNLAPLIDKLRQVFDMFSMWARLGTAPVAGQMIPLVRTTMSEAERLAEDQKRRVSPLGPRFEALAKRLTDIGKLDPEYQLVSIGQMTITLKDARRQMPQFTLNYNMPKKFPPTHLLHAAMRADMERQLSEQQSGVNSMIVAEWLKRRPLPGINLVRPTEEATMRATYGDRSHLAGTGRDAPHNPDQVLAGYIDPTGSPAIAAINRSIGRQNRDNAVVLQSHLESTITGAARISTQINVRLLL